jgi:hypothetical protein
MKVRAKTEDKSGGHQPATSFVLEKVVSKVADLNKEGSKMLSGLHLCSNCKT